MLGGTSIQEVVEMPDGKRDDFWGPVISMYTTEQAVEDGVLIYVGDVGTLTV
jgi:type I site-specific restriction endonuclease